MTIMRSYSHLLLGSFASLLFCDASTHQAVYGSSVVTQAECEMDGTCATETTTSSNTEHILDCGLYMAPSTLGEATNMGMYTGHALKQGDVVMYPEIAIPLYFREWGQHPPGLTDGELWDRYIWEGSVASLDPFDDRNRDDNRAVLVPGIGCTINSVMDMKNIDSTHGSLYDTAGLHRSKDPGTGAFAPYHSANTSAFVDVEPGAELFAEYGDTWIKEIPGAQITLEKQLQEAEDFLRDDFYPWIQAHQSELTEELKQALWELVGKDFPLYSQSLTNLPRGIAWKDIEAALEFHRGPFFSIVKKFIRQQSIRTISWLNENGYCVDHIRPGLSTIPQAGRGAFASRFLPKGTIVGYTPLIHMGLHGRDVYNVSYPGEKKRRSDLILNYSFGHKNSTVILTPYGGMIHYINHNSVPNVKIQWPNKELVAHKPEWLERSPETIRYTLEKIGLSFEYVALRDIQEGEEIFMDYGPEWEQAWAEHVKNWKPVEGSENYIHRTEWKEDYLRTESERKANPYPENFVMMCIDSFSATDDEKYTWIAPFSDTSSRVYCKALERSKEAPYLYTVQMQEDNGLITVYDVPAEGIMLYERAYSADWHLPNAFRHEIMIPDDIMPKAWLNGPHVPMEGRENEGVVAESSEVVDVENDEEDEDSED